MRVHRVLAPNPSLMTAGGTNSWVLEVDGHALVVDPGPLHDGHLAENPWSARWPGTGRGRGYPWPS